MALLVNGTPIDDATLSAEFSNIKAYFESQGNVSCCERDDEFRGYARQNVVARVLLAEEAHRRTATPAGAEIDAALEKLKEANGGEAQFSLMVGSTPEQLEAVRRDVETNLRVQRMLEDCWGKLPAPTEQELRAYYDAHQAEYASPEEVRASHISRNQGRGDEKLAAYELMRGVRTRLLAGEDFDELAREFSDKGKEEIDLGFFKRGDLPEEFELVAFSMNVGEISPVFASAYAYHVARVTDRRPPASKSFEEVREQLLKQVTDEHRQERTRELARELESKATIEEANEDESLDTSAVSGSESPVY